MYGKELLFISKSIDEKHSARRCKIVIVYL